MKPLAKRVSLIRRSGIRDLMELAGKMSDVIHLEIGEPDSNTPEHVITAAADAARAGYTKYTPTAGTPVLRQALARKLRERNGLDVQPEQVVITPGAVHGLAIAHLAVLDPGDEALLPDPSWPNFESQIHVSGAAVVRYPLSRQSGYQPDLAALRRLITPRTKSILINSPGNPTGAVFSPDTIKALVELAAEHDLYLISDEVYEEFVFEGQHVSAATFDRDGRVISIFAFSKTYAMTGWRVGYAVGSPELALAMIKIAEPLVANPSSIAQKAAEAALAGPQDVVAAMRDSYRVRRDAALAILEPAGLVASRPKGAFYILVDVSAVGTDSNAIARQLLQEQKVAAAPGDTFGAAGAGLLRISLATEKSLLEEGCRRIVQFVRQHGRQPVEAVQRA